MSHSDTSKHTSGVIAWFTRNHVSANLLMVVIILGGLYSAFTIKKALVPEFEFNFVLFTMLYPGASPEEIDRGIVLKVERAVRNLKGIKRITSHSRDSMASVYFEAEKGYDLDVLLNDVKIAVDGISTFPKIAEKPLITKFDFQFQAIQLQINGDGLSEKMGKNLAEQVKRELLANPNISHVDILGARDYEIGIEISDADLRKYGLSLSQVAAAIGQSSVNIPGGAIRTVNGDLMLKIEGQAYNQLQFEQVVLLTFADGTRLYLGDIATIHDGFVEQAGYSAFDRSFSIGLSIAAVGDQDVVTLANEVKDYVANKQRDLPAGVKITSWSDSSYYLQGRLQMMLKNLLMGAILVFILLALFMDLKIAFWVMVGLPVCFLGAFIFLPLDAFNVSINMISLFGFIVVLGIVVDDAIVIGESVHSTIDQRGHSTEAVIDGVKAVSVPAVFGVLTSICAFLPTLFIEGSVANYPAAAGYVVVFCLAFSLVESKLILPAHLNTMHTGAFRWLKSRQQDKVQHFFNGKLNRLGEHYYRPFMIWAIKHRYTTFAAFGACFILTVGLIAGGRVSYVMSPPVPSDYVNATLEMARGTPESQTIAAIKHVEDAIYRAEQEYLQTNPTAQPFIKHLFSYGQQGSEAKFKLELSKQEQRQLGSREIVQAWRQAVGDIPGAKFINFSDAEEKFGADIAFNLISNNPQQLQAASDELSAKLASYHGIYDVNNDSAQTVEEIVLSIKPGAEALGVSLAKLGSQVRDAFHGAEAQRVQRGESEVKVIVRYPSEHRQSIHYLNEMTIRTDAGDEVPFSAVAEVELVPALASKSRINGEVAVQVTAYADLTEVTPGTVVNEVIGDFFPELFARYPNVSYKLDGVTLENMKLEKSLAMAFSFSLLGIYVLLAIPLRSYVQPMIVMSVIPLGFIGAVVGHVILGVTVSMMSILGIIALAGVVVNDSLILVYFINGARERGVALADAALEAGCKRFRAIIITSLTTFFGVLPMMLETSVQAQYIIPMAISLGAGIIFATAITLVLLPCLYIVMDDMGRLLSFRRHTRSDSSPAMVNATE